MRRFLVFAFDIYYPCGGLNDVAESFDDLEAALDYVQTQHRSTQHVYVWDRVMDEQHDVA